MFSVIVNIFVKLYIALDVALPAAITVLFVRQTALFLKTDPSLIAEA